jgi:hypothetical protein
MEHHMRVRTVFAVGISAAALATSGLSVGVASAGSPAAPAAVAHSATGVSGTPTSFPNAKCGTSEGTWAADGFTAQDGAPTNPALSTWGAKQVKCKKLNVNQIVVDGYPNQAIDINFNIAVYKNTKKYDTLRYKSDPQPNDKAKALCSYDAQPGKFAAAGVTGAQWTIDLDTACKVKKKISKKGVWFAIQADLDQAFGQWFWAVQTTADVPNESDWADTQNLFGLGCVTFTAGAGSDRDTQDCLGQSGKPDFIMVLN